MLATLIVAALGQAVAAAPTMTSQPAIMTRAEIRTYNSKLASDHPAYIRCRKEPATGSLVRKIVSCRTNAEWRRSEDGGNDNARETMDAMVGKGYRTSDDPPP